MTSPAPLNQLGHHVRQAAAAAAAAVRRLSHLTDAAPPLPAPQLYAALVELEDLGHRLANPLRHLGVGLQRSLEVYAVVQDDGSDPAAAVDRRVFELQQAVADATDLGIRVGRASEAIASQGHRGRIPTNSPTTGATEED